MSEIGAEGAGINAGAFMAQAISEGLGVTEARNALRAAGMRMSNATFSDMYAQVRDTIGNRDAVQALGDDAIPAGADYTEWTMGEGDQYASFVTSYVRVPGQDGIEPRYFIYTTDAPHTKQDAMDAAADQYGDENLADYPGAHGTYQGSVVTSMTRTVSVG